ncbi:MAG TPA: adhesin [Pseudonocardiaceae bacterium]|jgi:Fe-S cluster assembly iron-binding protein IscA|nr:adhesin [Pseudonocardiaceae bacterium]
MLTVTEAAAQAINSLVTKHQMPEGAGLRITRQGKTTRSEGLGLSLAAAPGEDDSVVETRGVKIFLPPNLVQVLHDQELDVEHVTEDGGEQVRFTVDRRRSEPQQ